MRLGLLFICIVSQWLSAKSDAKHVTRNETTTYNDETRREDYPHQDINFEDSTQPSTDNVTVVKNETVTEKSTDVRTIELTPTFERTEGKEICSNAEFLVKILTVMLPLLQHDVPETTRTSAVLLILEDLLKSSPEAAKDHEVMYKINDLLQTLQKYHANNSDENKNALRSSNDAMSNAHGVKSKIAFKFEVPQFQNPNCTAELLKIIKVVQEAIMRLVNNPVCNSHIDQLGLPLIPNIDKNLLINHDLYEPGLYKYPSAYIPNTGDFGVENIYSNYDLQNKLFVDRLPSEGYPILDINFSDEYNVRNIIDSHGTNNEDNPTYLFNNIPSQYPPHPKKPASLIYPESKEIPHYPVNSYDDSPSDLSLKPISTVDDTEIPDIPIYITPRPYIEKYLPESNAPSNIPVKIYEPYETSTSFEIDQDHPGSINYIPFDQSLNNPNYEFNLPSRYPSNPTAPDLSDIDSDEEVTPRNPFEIYVPSSSPSPFEITGSGGSGYIPLDHNIPYVISPSNPKPLGFYGTGGSSLVKLGKNSWPFNPTPSTLEVFGTPSEGDIILNQESHKIPMLIDMNIETTTHPPFKVIDVGSGDVGIGNKYPYNSIPISYRPNSGPEFDWSSLSPGDMSGEFDIKGPNFEVDVSSSTLAPLSVEIDEGSDILHIAENRPYPAFEFNLPAKKPEFEVTGNDGFSEIPIGHDQSNHFYEFELPTKRPRPDWELDVISSTSSPFDVDGDGSGEINFGQNQPHPYFDIDLPSNNQKPYYKVDVESSTSLPSAFDVDGDGSGIVQVAQNRPYSGFEFDLLPNKPLSVIGDDGSAEINIGQNQPNSFFEFNLPTKPTPPPFEVIDSAEEAYISMGPPKQPSNRYDKSPESSPLINGRPDLSPDKSSTQHRYPDEIDKRRPVNQYLPYSSEEYLPSKIPVSPFTVIGDGSGEISINPSPYSIDFPNYYRPQRPQDKHINPYEYPSPPHVSEHPIPGYILPSEHSIDSYLGVPTEAYTDKLNSDIAKLLINDDTYPNKPSVDLLYPSIPESKFPEYYVPNQEGSNKLYPDQPKNLDYDDIPKRDLLDKDLPSNLNYPNAHPYPYNPLEEDNQYSILPYVPIRPKEIDLSVQSSSQDDTIFSKPITSHSSFYIPDKNSITPESEEISYEETDMFKPVAHVMWDGVRPKYPIVNSPVPTPDKKILLIIKDNIDVIEHKIPKIHLNIALHDHINKIKELMNLEEITVEEYINLINRYEILIEYIKHSNISGEILNDLLLSMTNGGTLDLQPGKSKVIELTYLVKRPTPLIYQPYYYIKYRLPYGSFLSRMENLLAEKPQLSKYPANLYKSLIPMSNLAETSPDLEGYGKKEIVKLAFSNGTLVGAKVIKGKDVDMYASLNMLKEINREFTLDDVYQLIRNLDVQLKKSEEDNLVYQNSDKVVMQTIINNLESKLKSNGLNDNNDVQKITVKINKKPMLANKVTKIITKKVPADQLIANILNQVNNLRSNNMSESHTLDRNTPSLKDVSKETSKELRSKSLEGNNINLNDLVKPIQEISSLGDDSLEGTIESSNLSQDKKLNKLEKTDISLDYRPMFSDIFDDIGKTDLHLGLDTNLTNSEKPNDDNKVNLKPTQLTAEPDSYLKTKLKDVIRNGKKKRVFNTPTLDQFNYNSLRLKSENPYVVDDLSSVLDSSIGAKLLDATLKAQNYKQMYNSKTHEFEFESAPVKSGSASYIDGNSNILTTQNMIKHSNNYFFDSPDAVHSNLMKDSQAYATNDRDSLDSNLIKHSQTYTIKHSKMVEPGMMKHSQNYIGIDPNNFANNYESYIVNPNNEIKYSDTYYNNNPNNIYKNFAKNSGNYIVPNQNSFQNNLMKRYQYQTIHRLPYVYHQQYTYPKVYSIPMKRG